MPNMEELISKISAKITKKLRRDMDVQNRLGLRIWTGKTIS